MIVLLDAGPLGMLSHPNVGKNRDLHQWVRTLIQNDGRVVVPEIADYEVRRELIRANKTEGLGKLDALKLAILEYLPLTTRAMERAARFWADSRQRGLPTCHDAELDADAILAAQAATHPEGLTNVVIATTNVGDLAQFVPAKPWQDIR